MASERVQRQIDRLLDEAETAMASLDWETVARRAQAALALDEDNADAQTYLAAAHRGLGGDRAQPPAVPPDVQAPPARPPPSSFANGRYSVQKLLGEGGKKLVYLAHDERLDRDVAFALIKTDGLDDAGRQRVAREARAMGRLGDHDCLMPIYDSGDEDGQPYLVLH